MPSFIELKLSDEEILEFVNFCYESKSNYSIKQKIFNDEDKPFIFHFNTGIRFLEFLYYKDTTEIIKVIIQEIEPTIYDTRKIKNKNVYEELKNIFDSMLVMLKLNSNI